MKRLLIMLAICGYMQAVHAQDRAMTLREVLDMAKARNAGLASAGLRVRAAEARIAQAEAWDEPRVSVEAYSIPARSLNIIRDNMEWDYSIEQMIPFPGKKRLMGDMQRAAVDMEAGSASMASVRLEADVRSAHAMLWGAERRLTILREIRALAEQIASSVRERYAVGRASQVDALRAQSVAEKLASDERDVLADRRSAAAMLNALIGSASGSMIELTDMPDTTLPASPVEELVAHSSDRPDLRAMRAEITMNRAERDAMKREMLPDFMIRGMYKQMLMDEPDYWAVMVGITVPIAPWSEAKYSARQEAAEVTAQAGEQLLLDMRRMAEARVREAWEKAAALRDRAARFRDALIPQAEQAFNATLASYRTGGSDFTAVLDSYRMLAMYRMDLEMLTADYATALARLTLAVGRNS